VTAPVPAPAAARRGHLLLGFPRSGTTLLSRLLDSHPQVSSPPETYLMAAAARFLHEQDRVEGPPIGVLAGLAFAGFTDEEVRAPLRRMVFDFHDRIAGDRPVWVEKTAIDIFHLETLEPLLAGHVRFLVIERHPLDVILSNLRLAEVMGAQLQDLWALTQGVNGPHDGIARAWADRMAALRAFAGRHPGDVCWLSYEDLTREPAAALARVFDFLGVGGDPAEVIERAFAAPPRTGLGDFNFDGTTAIRPAPENAWRGRIPPAALARILPVLEPQMTAGGYEVPKAPRLPDRATAVRQFQLAAALKRDRSRRDAEG
jgi:hypothetical protein